jgi:hypothetical protein
MEQGENIKSCSKMGETAKETFQLIRRAYDDNAISPTPVSEWYPKFRDGFENL